MPQGTKRGRQRLMKETKEKELSAPPTAALVEPATFGSDRHTQRRPARRGEASAAAAVARRRRAAIAAREANRARQAAEGQVAHWLSAMALQPHPGAEASASDRLAALRARVRAKEAAASAAAQRSP